MMLRRKNDVTKANKQSKAESRRNSRKKTAEVAQKGRGRRAQKTIREPTLTQKQRKAPQKHNEPGPPLKISGGSSKKQVSSITPETVVKNSKGGRKR